MAAYLASCLLETAILLAFGRAVMVDWRYLSASHQHTWLFALLLAAAGGIALGAFAHPWVIPLWPENINTEYRASNAALLAALLDELALLYLAGLGFLLVLWVIDLLGLYRLTRRARPLPARAIAWHRILQGSESSKPVRILVSCEIWAPVTWGVFRHVVLIPPGALRWEERHAHWTLIHELAHIRRRDWLSQQVARVICSLFWPIPMAWHTFADLCLEAERAADDNVVRAGLSPAEYATWLLAQAMPNNKVGAVALARPSTLQTRLHHILDRYAHRTSDARIAPACFLLALTFSIGLSQVEFGKLYLRDMLQPRPDDVTHSERIPPAPPVVNEMSLVRRLGAVADLPPIAPPSKPLEVLHPPSTAPPE